MEIGNFSREQKREDIRTEDKTSKKVITPQEKFRLSLVCPRCGSKQTYGKLNNERVCRKCSNVYSSKGK